MRNLKKLLAVVLTVVMMASMMVPALAANTYEAEALKLQSIGMFAGEPADLKLEEGVTRIQGLAFAIRAAGVEADAFAMTDEEVAAILADYVDGADVPAWGVKYAAYAIKNGITVGVSATEKKFAGLDPISGTSFLVFLMKAGMGYADVTTADVIEASVEAGILTAGQAATFGAKAALIRDDAAGILFGAAMNGVNADGTPLIEALIASGFVDEDAALAAGFVVEVVPDALEVVSVTTDNLKQLVVKFNQPIKEAGDDDNYELETVEDEGLAVLDEDSGFDLLDDEMTVVLTLTDAADQQELVNLTIKDIEAVSGADFEEVTIEEIELFDNTIPKAVSASVVGKYAIKVIFSEPIAIEEDELEDLFVVEDGDYIIDEVKKVKNDTELNVYLYSALEDGTLSIECLNGIKDYAGYGIAKKTFEVEVVEDEEAPEVIGYKDAKPGSIVLIFNEDIVLTEDAEDDPDEFFYHTNSNNAVSTVPVADGNELKLTFAGAELPEGTARIVIEKEALQDLWENDNAKISLTVEITLDTTKPTLDKVKQDDNEYTAILTFSEELEEDTAEETDNYTLLDKDGKVMEDAVIGAELGGDDLNEVTLTFDEDLSGSYSIVVQKVEDLAGNAISKTTVSFEMKDTTDPDEEDISAKLYDAGKGIQLLKVSFGEAVAVTGAFSVLDLDKYEIDDTNLSDVDDVTIKAVDSNKAVEIRIPEEKFKIDVVNHKLVIARYADAAGNKLPAFATKDIDIDKFDVVEFKSVKLTAGDTIVVTLKDKLTTFKADDFILYKDTSDTGDDDGIYNVGDTLVVYSRVRHTVNSDNVSVVTFTLKEDFGTIVDDSDGNLDLRLATKATASKNTYGEFLDDGVDMVVADKAAPVVIDKGISVNAAGTEITIEFSEAIKKTTFLSGALNGFSVSGGKAELDSVTLSGKIITLTGEDFTRNTDVSYNKVFGLTDGVGNKIASFTQTDALEVE